MSNIIELKNIMKSYDGVTNVVENINLEIKKGEFVTFLGPSGCGKTTLLNLIAGLLKADGGTIGEIPQPCSLLFQEDRLLPWLNAKQNVALVLDDEGEEKASQLLRELGIEPDMALSKMSGGMKRRVALARALALKSEILLLDEPFKGLDENLMKSCADLVKKQGKLTIVATHSQKEAEELGAKIIRIEDGIFYY